MPKRTINPLFAIGQPVYLKTDPEQHVRLCTGYEIRQDYIIYYISYLDYESGHFGFALSAEKDTFKLMGLDEK